MDNLPEKFEGDAHDFLESVYKNPAIPLEVRIMAAGRALRVEKPVLSAVHSRMDVHFDFAARLESARKRLVEHRRTGLVHRTELPPLSESPDDINEIEDLVR
jgi:hypothetical protein